MRDDLDVLKDAINDFKEIQEFMLSAKKENATETYALMKRKYHSLKALLQVSGVNFTEIDKIKE